MSFRKILLIVITLTFAGCLVTEPPSMDAIHRARELVDQGVIYLELGELERAEATFRVAFEVAEIPQSLDGLGCVAFLRGDFESAEKLFNQAYALDPAYTYVLGNLALLYEQQGAAEKSLALYQRAIELNPANFQFRNNFGVFLKQKLDYPNLSVSELRKGAALSPDPLIEYNLKQLGVNLEN